MGFPAARVTDNHVCPQVTVLVPHVGGPIIPPCAPTVTVGTQFQSRILDQLICVGPLDLIQQGESTVLVCGLPASRLLHTTVHGGVIVTGLPTVLIGSSAPGGQGTVTFKVAPGSTSAFVTALQNALATILPTRSGIVLLAHMAANGNAITFQQTNAANGYCSADNPANSTSPPGSSSTISWNPNYNITDASLPGTQGSPGSAVILAHEMVHATHNGDGNNRNGPNDTYPGQSGSSQRNEERSTVGTQGPITLPSGAPAAAPDYSNNVPTENSFRDDLGIPRRPSYYPQNWPGGAPW